MYCPESKTRQRQRKTGRQTDRKTDRQSDRHLDRHIGKKRTRKYKTTGHAFKFTDLVVSCIGQRARKGHSSRQTEPLHGPYARFRGIWCSGDAYYQWAAVVGGRSRVLRVLHSAVVIHHLQCLISTDSEFGVETDREAWRTWIDIAPVNKLVNKPSNSQGQW